MKFSALILIFLLSSISPVLWANTGGLYHQFATNDVCQTSQQIFMDEGVITNNYKGFIDSLVNKLESGNDVCTMSMVLNLQSFIRHLIKTNNADQYNLFFDNLNKAYLLSYNNELEVLKTCRLHSNPGEEDVQNCLSDHIIDIAVLSNRSWYEYFSENIKAQSNLRELWNESLIGAAGAGVISVLFRSQIKRYGIKVLKQISNRLRSIFSPGRTSSFARSGSLGLGGGTYNGISSQETELSLRSKLEAFKGPLEFIAMSNEENQIIDDFDALNDPYKTVRDISGIVFAGVLPIMLVESNAYRLAYLVPHLGVGLGARAAVHTRRFLKQPMGRILAALVATATVGNFLVDEWNMYELKKLLADFHGKIAAIEESLTGADPHSLSTYLLTQELVNLTQTLSLIYAGPVVSELERKYHWYSTAAICRPINAVYRRVPLEEIVDFYIPKNMDRIRQSAEELLNQEPSSCFSSVQKLFNGSEESIPGSCYKLYDGQDPMELSISTLVNSLSIINTHVGIPEYQGLKMKIYDIIDYLIRFKSPEHYSRKLESLIQSNYNESIDYAPPLLNFAVAFLNASAPYQLEIPIQTWNEYLRSIKYYRGKQKEAEFTGYRYGCSYGEFGVLFNDFDFLYSKRIPCESDDADEYDQCVQCEDRKDPLTCQIIKK